MNVWNSRGLAALIAIVAALAGGPSVARADSPLPDGYWVEYTGTTARICNRFHDWHPVCPGQGLLREDANGGATVLINTCDASGCFVDECVPPGTYRYGLLEPLTSWCAGWYGSGTTTADASGCTRSVAAPVPFTGTVPWASATRDTAGECWPYGTRSGCASGGGTAVLGVNAIALGVGLLLLRRRRGAAGRRA